ncbi:MAG: hypothetical protein AMXMBFR16_10150 [Candidatus Uhrbacteria bacterium]
MSKVWSIVALVLLGIGGSAVAWNSVTKYRLDEAYDNIVPTTVTVLDGKADIVVEGPSEVKVGKMARLDVSKSSAKTIKWRVIPDTEDLEVYADGRKACFCASEPGVYTFIVAGAMGDDVDVEVFVVKVVTVTGGGGNGGGGGGGNGGGGGGGAPTGFVAQVLDWTNLVASPNKAAESAALADSFAAIKAQVVAGTLKNASEIATATRDANRLALKDSLVKWLPFLEKLQAELKAQALAGTLVTPADHARVWQQVVDGLRLAAAK